jgi:hypothetical protein
MVVTPAMLAPADFQRSVPYKLDNAQNAHAWMVSCMKEGRCPADDPAVDNAMTFPGTTTVSVTAKTNTAHNF